MTSNFVESLTTAVNNQSEVVQSLQSGKAVEVTSIDVWENLIRFLAESKYHSIALRGAGSTNGMEKPEVDALLIEELIPRVNQLLKGGKKVCLLYDGDQDNLSQPDIGYVMGRLADYFGNSIDKVLLVTAQKRSWYYPANVGANLANARGIAYATYIFEDNAHPGEHNSFTQHQLLVSSNEYEQWYIGACGQISSQQLLDYNEKATANARKRATLFKVRQNDEMGDHLNHQLQKAIKSNDEITIRKIELKIAQREKIYGEFWNNDGDSTIHLEMYPNLDIHVVEKPTLSDEATLAARLLFQSIVYL